ncbi:MAG: J domain-containing protein [Bacteroidia bacterium]
MTDLYRILGVSEYATDQQIRQAYRSLAKRYHPDLNQGDSRAAEKFREIASAYEVLSDPILRSNYDKKRLREALYTPGPFFSGSQNPQPESDTAKRRTFYSEATWNWAERKRRHTQEAHMSRRRNIFVAMTISFVLFIGAAFWFDNWVQERRLAEAEELAALYKNIQKESEEQFKPPVIQDFDSPFDTIFGKGVYEDFSPHSITVLCPPSESVVCLVQAKAPWRTIRNEYVTSGKWFTLRNVPKGAYFFKIYAGANWDTKIKQRGIAAGGFALNPEYYISQEDPIILTSETSVLPNIKDTLSLQPGYHRFRKVSAQEFLVKEPENNPQR